MCLFEKIEMEPIEPDPPTPVPPSTRQWGAEPLVVPYAAGKKAMMLVVPLLSLPVLPAFLGEGFVFELLVVAGVAIGAWYLAGCLVPRSFTFFPDRIVRDGWFGQAVLPAEALVMMADEQRVRFFHGTEKNIREAMTVRRVMTSEAEMADILTYAADHYHITAMTGGAAVARGTRPSSLALAAYHEAVSSYWTMTALLAVIALVALFTVGVTDNFTGLGPGLPAFPVRLAAMAGAALAYLLLRRLAPVPQQGSTLTAVPLETRFKRAGNASFTCAAVAVGVALLGLVIFFLFGNLLDLYLFLLVGVLYFFDYFPRLSDWEGALRPWKADEPASAAMAAPRRSLQVSLVLMGALAIASQGESQRYLYASRQDCLNDWGDGKDCQEPPPGSSHYGTHYYYGPRYGTGGGRTIRSVGVGTVSRGGFGSLASFHASFGG